MVAQVETLGTSALAEHAQWLSCHQDFAVSDRLRHLLAYLVGEVEVGQQRAITQREIATQVLGYDESFDPQVDAHVRIEVSRLRKALDLFYGTCDEPLRERIVIPKGQYRPGLQALPRKAPQSLAAAHPEPLRVALATLTSNTKCGLELADLIRRETVHRAQRSPLVQSGDLSLYCLVASNEAESVDEAKRLGARFCAVGSLHLVDTTWKIYLSLVDVFAGRTLWSESFSQDLGPRGDLKIAVRASDHLVSVIADPMVGLVPRLLADSSAIAHLSTVMMAYDFIRTQRLDQVPTVLAGLNRLEREGKSSATSLALQADMLRVSHNLNRHQGNSSGDEVLEKASLAMARDPENLAARLAMGYALLNVGRKSGAAQIARRFPADSCPGSLAGDARLLAALCGTGLEEVRNVATPSGFFDEFATSIGAIVRGDYGAALERLEASIHEDVFWLQIFRSAIYRASGEVRSSRVAKRRLFALVPNIEDVAEGLIGGFFVDSSVQDFFKENLRLSEV